MRRSDCRNDSLIAQFIVYGEHRRVDPSLGDLQSGIEDFSESLYAITGIYRGVEFRVEYTEWDELVLIDYGDELLGVLSLININPNSRFTLKGNKLSRNKKFLSFGTGIGKPKIMTEEAQWYPIYTAPGTTEQGVTEMGFLLMFLFFAMGQAGS